MGATRTYDLGADKEVDAQALFEKLQEQIKDDEIDPNLYRGAAGYRKFIKPRDTPLANASSGLSRKGADAGSGTSEGNRGVGLRPRHMQR